ncbi:MAG: DEAD/DEAH box helicase family protein [Patescibacteria group bacterium]
MNEKFFGTTGTVGVDGELSPDQGMRLNRLQSDTAHGAVRSLAARQTGELFPMAAMATGIGKGNIIHRVIETKLRDHPDARILVVAGTKTTLVKQTHQSLAGYQESGANYVTAEDDEELVDETTSPESDPLADQNSLLYATGKLGQKGVNVEIGTIQKVQSQMRRGNLDPDDYDLVIVDEVHNLGTASRKRDIARFKNVLGFTATPHRHSGKMKKPEEYGFEIFTSYPLPEAQRDGLLPPLLGVQIDTTGLVEDIPTNSSGKIDYKKLEKILKKSPELRPFIAERVASLISNPEGEKYKTVIAVNFVWEAAELAKLLHEKGVKVGLAINKQGSNQLHTEAIPAVDSIERYKLSHQDPRALQVLISPYVASEGFDAPFTEILVWASATDSSLRYTQYTGRLARRAQGKKFGLVVDFLYQTAQYGWSYNMGMWMKGDVQQLANGLLYLGSEADIGEISHSASTEAFRAVSDRKSLSELQEEVIPMQDGEIALTLRGLQAEFIGGKARLSETAIEMRGAVPAVYRRNNTNNLVPVVPVEERATLLRMMKDRGFAKRQSEDLQQVQLEEIVITNKGLRAFFRGTSAKLLSTAQATYAQISEHHPEFFTRRQRGRTEVLVVTEDGTAHFIRAMQENGISIKDDTIEPVQETDFTLTQKGAVEVTFVGSVTTPKRRLSQIVTKIRVLHPEWFVQRASGGNLVEVVPDEFKAAFVAAMLDQGAQLRLQKEDS